MAKPVRKNVGELDVVDWGADYFGLDPSSANIQDVINKAPDGSRIGFEEGRYLLEAPLYYADKTLHFYARGKVELVQTYAQTAEPMLHAERADHSEFVGFDFIGADNAAYYITNYSALVSNLHAGLRITNSKDTFVSRCTVKDKLVGFAFVQCERNHSDSLYVKGYGDAIRAAGGIPNLHFGISYVQGRDNENHSSTTTDTGNGFIFGSFEPGLGVVNPENIKLFGPSVYESEDNGIYVSSAREIQIHGAHVENIWSSGIRVQGDDISIIGGCIKNAGAGVGITGLSATPIHDGLYASHNVSIIGTTIEGARIDGILIDDKSNSGTYTDDVRIIGVTIRDSLGNGIYGTADNVTIADTHIADTAGRAIHLEGRGSLPNPKNQLINNVSIIRTGGESIFLERIKDSTITEVRDCDGIQDAFLLNGVSNSDLVNLRSTSGRLFEDGGSAGNLIANCRGPAGNVTNGSSHRPWQVVP